MGDDVNKQTYRHYFIEQRKAMDKATHNMFNTLLMEGLRNVLSEYPVKKIAVFNPILNEVDVRGLKDSYEIYYPKIMNGELQFVKDTGEFTKGMLGVMEPSGDVSVEKSTLDAIIVPGLAYDLGLYRLGYGKGFYDRYLKDYKGLKVGVTLELFMVEALPNKAHDIPVDILVTDTMVYENEYNEL